MKLLDMLCTYPTIGPTMADPLNAYVMRVAQEGAIQDGENLAYVYTVFATIAMTLHLIREHGIPEDLEQIARGEIICASSSQSP